MTVLFMALSCAGFGETLIGIFLARRLQQRGITCHFVIDEASTTLLSNGGIEYTVLKSEMGTFARLVIDQTIARTRPDLIILSDYLTFETVACKLYNIDPWFLLNYDIPVIPIDIWELEKTTYSIDILWDSSLTVSSRITKFPAILRPVPFCHLEETNERYLKFSLRPPGDKVSKRTKAHLRAALGLGVNDKIVLLAMAKWQTPMMQSEMGNRMAAGVPALLATYFAKLPANVHFVNVGARVEGMHQALRGNISYIPQCSPDRFDVLLGSADLLLGLNVGATTVARAMFAGTPTLVLSNRYRIASAEDRTLDAFAADTKSWVLKHLPLYPMRMMPLGFYAFFGPIVEDNSYFNTFEHAELLHEPDVIHKMHELLFNPIARAAMAARRETYLAELDLLSDPTDSIVALSGVTSAV